MRRGALLLITILPTLTGCVTWSDVSRPANSLKQAAINKCASVEAGAARLACYDQVTAAAQGSWRIARTVSAGDRNVYLSLSASALTSVRPGQSIRPTLWARCQQEQTALFVSWGTYLGTSEANVSYRLDASAPRIDSWAIANDREVMGLWRSTDAVPFIKALLDAEQLVLEVTLYDGRAFTGRFELAGIKQAIVPLREACGW